MKIKHIFLHFLVAFPCFPLFTRLLNCFFPLSAFSVHYYLIAEPLLLKRSILMCIWDVKCRVSNINQKTKVQNLIWYLKKSKQFRKCVFKPLEKLTTHMHLLPGSMTNQTKCFLVCALGVKWSLMSCVQEASTLFLFIKKCSCANFNQLFLQRFNWLLFSLWSFVTVNKNRWLSFTCDAEQQCMFLWSLIDRVQCLYIFPFCWVTG